MEGAIPIATNTRIAVVTGGNKGIGFEVCRQLASKGITVILTARNEKRGSAAVQELKDAGLHNVIFHQLDITDAPGIARLADFLKARFGRIDFLVNNGALGAVEYVEDPANIAATSEEELRGMSKEEREVWMYSKVRETLPAAKEGIRTNYYGTKDVTEGLLPLLKAAPDGRILFVSSDFGLIGQLKDEQLKKELDDIDNLTEKKLDEMLTTYLKDFEAGALEARGWPTHFSAYRMGLVAMNAYSRIIARRHHELCINCANPGYIKTDMSVYTGTLTPAEGANNLLKVLLLPQGGPTGKYFDEGTEAPFV
ncbi:hypothetical protein PAHAL_8G169900 [Panicum hallii]|uniref:(+)-neomenthol dehydrogenase n=1 Tax=Panicum hallii TaxID=206008 RepID=A0A2S3IE51_9POAL|nr:(-)-isopiperitenone reductase-like [Panicum hallii]PAN42569.1 hypothetical protein PAHAL_8G169900 [Panicum hallii]